MKKILLIDDEALLLNHTKNLIDWGDIGCSVQPRSLSFATSTVAVWSASAFFLRSSFVMSVTAFSASIACFECASPREMSIWLFHSGIVFTMVDWIFSVIRASLFCTSLI